MSRPALDAMTACIAGTFGNPSSLHSIGQQAYQVLTEAREKIASFLGCQANEIIFTSGGSESDNQAIRSAASIGVRSRKKHILSAAFEHHAVLHTLEQLKAEGFEITLLDVPRNGIIDPDQVASAIRPDTCLVTVMYANNEIGTIQPIREIGAVCRKHGVLFHTDAVQAVGHLPIDVVRDNIDLLSASAHKFHGPKGVGFLYARKGIRLTNLIEGGAQENGKRAGTENVPGIVSMAAALKEAAENMERNREVLTAKRDHLIRGLKEIPHSALNGDAERRLPGNVNFCFEGIEGESLLLLLDDRGIAASSGSACTSGSLDPSHVLLAIGRVHDVAHGSLRLSIGEDITDEDVEYIIKNVKEVVEYLRGFSPVWRDLVAGKTPFILP
jgi:cysteine desulfurase